MIAPFTRTSPLAGSPGGDHDGKSKPRLFQVSLDIQGYDFPKALDRVSSHSGRNIGVKSKIFDEESLPCGVERVGLDDQTRPVRRAAQ